MTCHNPISRGRCTIFRFGREGVAYTFVCPEEGYELTRIEERINLLLKRAEIHGFEHSKAKAVTAPPLGPDGEPLAVPTGPAPPPPPASAQRRPPKRYRRAL